MRWYPKKQPGSGNGHARRSLFRRRDARTRMRPSGGFSLVELITVIVLAGIIFGFGSVLISKSFSSYVLKRDTTDADWQAKVALERAARELRAVRSATAADLAVAAAEIRFFDADGNKLCFYQNGTTLMRAVNGPADASCLVGPISPQQLADNIKAGSLKFTYWTTDGQVAATVASVYYITVELTVVEGSYSAPFRTNVRPRNF